MVMALLSVEASGRRIQEGGDQDEQAIPTKGRDSKAKGDDKGSNPLPKRNRRMVTEEREQAAQKGGKRARRPFEVSERGFQAELVEPHTQTHTRHTHSGSLSRCLSLFLPGA